MLGILNPDNQALGTFSTIWNQKISEMHSFLCTQIYIYIFFEKLLVTASHLGLHPFLQSKLLHSTKDFPYKVKGLLDTCGQGTGRCRLITQKSK